MAAFLRVLGVEQPFVAGNSLGGWVALELALAGEARAVCAIAPAGLWSEPLVTFDHTAGDATKCNVKKNYNTTVCKLPSDKAYEAALRAFFAAFPSVKVVSPWNEITL